MSQLHAPAILPPVKNHGTHWRIGSRVGLRAGLEFVENRKFFASCQDLNLGSSSPKPSFYTDWAIGDTKLVSILVIHKTTAQFGHFHNQTAAFNNTIIVTITWPFVINRIWHVSICYTQLSYDYIQPRLRGPMSLRNSITSPLNLMAKPFPPIVSVWLRLHQNRLLIRERLEDRRNTCSGISCPNKNTRDGSKRVGITVACLPPPPNFITIIISISIYWALHLSSW
jgi:hypothetical protein